MIKDFVLKHLVVFSIALTAFQAKLVNAQISYMAPPGPWPKPGPGPISPNNIPTDYWAVILSWALPALVIIIFLVGLVVIIKWIVNLIIRLVTGRKK